MQIHPTARWIKALLILSILIPARAALAQNEGPPPRKIVHLHLDGMLVETPHEDAFGLTGEQVVSTRELLNRLRQARLDQSVQAVVLTYSDMLMGIGQLEELRAELLRLREAGKPVHVHVESLEMTTYALFSAAKELCVVPTGDVWLTGIYGESMYLKGMLDKIGVQADFLQTGDYKSAAETLTRSDPSPAAAENLDWLLDDLYKSLVAMIAEGRGLDAEKVSGLIDKGPYTAEQALEAGLIDSVSHRPDFVEAIRKHYDYYASVENRYAEEAGGPKPDFSNPFAFFSIFSEMAKHRAEPAQQCIALVYVEGIIVPGYAQPNPFGSTTAAYSGDLRDALEDAAADPEVRAVVLRVDSPGGSATASEIILDAAARVQAAGKPLIVSMGTLAASGGYYVACGADTIFADRTTLTASIGVVGGKLVTTGLWEKLGVNWVAHQRGANADLMSSSHPFSEAQRGHVDAWMGEIYGAFRQRVETGRGDKLKKPLEELAGGRVYTGAQALELGLVDKIGGLADAIAHAAGETGVPEVAVRVMPKPRGFFELLLSEMSGDGERPSDITLRAPRRPGLAPAPRPPLLDQALPLLAGLEPERALVLRRALARAELIRRERAALMLPYDWLIR